MLTIGDWGIALASYCFFWRKKGIIALVLRLA
jgi:hypothetical protein